VKVPPKVILCGKKARKVRLWHLIQFLFPDLSKDKECKKQNSSATPRHGCSCDDSDPFVRKSATLRLRSLMFAIRILKEQNKSMREICVVSF
jgi:hypothetical protein